MHTERKHKQRKRETWWLHCLSRLRWLRRRSFWEANRRRRLCLSLPFSASDSHSQRNQRFPYSQFTITNKQRWDWIEEWGSSLSHTTMLITPFAALPIPNAVFSSPPPIFASSSFVSILFWFWFLTWNWNSSVANTDNLLRLPLNEFFWKIKYLTIDKKNNVNWLL